MPAELRAGIALAPAGDALRGSASPSPGEERWFLPACGLKRLQGEGSVLLPRLGRARPLSSAFRSQILPVFLLLLRVQPWRFPPPKLSISRCLQKVLEEKTVDSPQRLGPGLPSVVQDLKGSFADIADLKTRFKGFKSDR